jgi:cell division transport system ATP-binding protein
MEDKTPIISFRKADILNGEAVVIYGLDMDVYPGDFVYIVGKVGTGKTSIIRTIIAENRLETGTGEACGFKLNGIKDNEIPFLRRKMGVVFQDFQLLVDRNVEENLMFVLKATGWKDKQAMKNNIHDVLHQVGMAEKAYKMPYQLSGGEQQRVVIARALLNAPGLILADEPTGNLDPETGKGIMELLYSISQAGMTVIMSTHNHAWPEQYPGRKLQFADGKISEL